MNSIRGKRNLTDRRDDLLMIFLGATEEHSARFCVIGGQALNLYAKPVLTTGLDLVVEAGRWPKVREALEGRVTIVEHSDCVEIHGQGSGQRLRVWTDPRLQDFIPRARLRTIRGFKMCVAAPEDLLQSQVWIAQDESRPETERQRARGNMERLVRAMPELETLLPQDVAP